MEQLQQYLNTLHLNKVFNNSDRIIKNPDILMKNNLKLIKLYQMCKSKTTCYFTS